MESEIHSYLKRHYRNLEDFLSRLDERKAKRKIRKVSAELEQTYRAIEALKKRNPGPARELLKSFRAQADASLQELLAGDALEEVGETTAMATVMRLTLDVMEIDRVLKTLGPRR